MVLSITLLRDYQETIKTGTEFIKETICDIRPPLYLLWGKPWGKMPINVEKPYAEVSVPFSALIFQQIASDNSQVLFHCPEIMLYICWMVSHNYFSSAATESEGAE